MKKTAWMAGMVLVAGVVQQASAALIASESFSTGQTAGDYTGGQAMGSDANKGVTVGTSGYSGSWSGATPFIKPNVTSYQHKMDHPWTTGAAPTGSVFATTGVAGEDRSTSRSISSAPAGGTIYLSGLVMRGASTALSDPGEEAIMGIMGDGFDANGISYAQGLHLGLYRNDSGYYRLAAYAGGNRYILREGVSYQQTYQIVLKLDLNASGDESFSAWYSDVENNVLTLAVDNVAIETWSGTTDMDRLAIQTRGLGTASGGAALLDEMRLGTTMADVTTIPEPVAMGLVGLVYLGALFIIRRRLVM